VCPEDSFACDGILVPDASDLTSPVILLEASVTHPCKRKKEKFIGCQKLRKKLMALPCFAGREVLVAFCYHEGLTKEQHEKVEEDEKDPNKYQGFYTIDRKELEKVGVRF